MESSDLGTPRRTPLSLRRPPGHAEHVGHLVVVGPTEKAELHDLGGGTTSYRSPGQEIDLGQDPDVRTDAFGRGRVGPLIPDVPADLAAMLDVATRAAREDRDALAKDRGRSLCSEPVSARPWTPPYARSCWTTRHRTVAAVFGVTAAAWPLVALGGGASCD